MSRKKRFRVYYSVGEGQAPASTPWHLWIDATSVYLLNFAMIGLKVSLHGTDPRHPLGGRFHVRLDRLGNEAPLRPTSDVLVEGPAGGWPCVFTGQQTDLGALAVRIRVTEAACRLRPPLAALPRRPSSASVALPIPPADWAADLDLTFQQLPSGFVPVNDFGWEFSCEWGQTKFSAALAGPPRGLENQLRTSLILPRPYRPTPKVDAGFRLAHKTGIVLRATTHNRRITDTIPTPAALTRVEDPDSAGRRSLRVDVVDGLLWIVEDAAAPAAATASKDAEP